MNPGTLTRQQVEQFMRDGYVMVPGAFPRAVAEAIVPLAYAASSFEMSDRGTWDRAILVVEKNLSGGPIDELYTPTVLGAMDDLMGAGRYESPEGLGYVVFNMPGFAKPPWHTIEQHVDGDHFHHYLDSPDQGVVLLFLYSDLGAEGGGTSISVGSHRITAKILAEAGSEGIANAELGVKVRQASKELPHIEAIGEAGDMLIMHPFTLHGSSSNLSDMPRVASNKCVALRDRMQFHRADPSDRSPVEQAIVEALM